MPRLCEFNLGICLTTEEKARKNPSQGSRRMSQGSRKVSQGSRRKGNHLHTSSIRESSNNTDLKVLSAFVILAPVQNSVRVSALFKNEYEFIPTKYLNFTYIFMIFLNVLWTMHRDIFAQ